MSKRSKNAKPLQLALPGFDPVQRKPWSVRGCIDLKLRRYLPEFYSWRSMIVRCENPQSAGYSFYGGKGVKVCPEWRRSFAAFVRDMGRRPDGMTLDRIDASGDYEPANCRWLDAKENSGRASALPVAGFPSLNKASASLSGAGQNIVKNRLVHGWCEEHAATLPKGSKRPADCAFCGDAYQFEKPIFGRSSITQAARILGMSQSGMSARLASGWCEEHAATLPKGSKRPADCEACASKAVR